jgi:hypothetical protein
VRQLLRRRAARRRHARRQAPLRGETIDRVLSARACTSRPVTVSVSLGLHM